MSEGSTLIRTLPPLLQLEIESLRDQRDLYRSLLLADARPLGAFLTEALQGVERLRSTLRVPTRDEAAFRGKLERLHEELDGLGARMLGLHLPTVASRLAATQGALAGIEQRAALSGNDLLPVMVLMEELCNHLTVAADCASVHVPLEEPPPRSIADSGRQRTQSKLGLALDRLVQKLAMEQGRQVTLVTLGLEEVPENWVSPLFDVFGQLLRNAVEHGIETPERRAALLKPETGTVVIEFSSRGGQGCELNVHDDGAGLNAERIAEVAVRQGLLSPDLAQGLDHPRLASLIFHPGLSTAADPGNRGHGMQIVRDHIVRLGGRIQVAAKRGQFTRYRISLPAFVSAATTGVMPAMRA